ncbi:MAG: hypothetical protein IPP13_21635 [Kouleothrix sp.]|jgi:hypothetical protein|nr:hypothetical protein [Kouleothrix sp.]
MTASYGSNGIAPDSADCISRVRFLIQDTDDATAELTDEEIITIFESTSEDESNTVRNYRTAVHMVKALHRRYAKQASFSSGKTSVQYQARAKYFETVVEDLQSELMAALVADGYIDQGGVMYAGRSTSFNDAMALNQLYGRQLR